MIPSCGTCRYGEPGITADDEQLILECRRYPPQLFVVNGDVARTWPQMQSHDWCGEWAEALP